MQKGNPLIKPAMWCIDPGIVAYNCSKYGFPVPVLAMPFWEGSGNKVYDVSGKGNHGTLVNHTRWASDRDGPTLSFDGTDDYVNVGNTPSTSITTGTISIWIKPTAFLNQWTMYVSKGNYNTSRNGYCLMSRTVTDTHVWVGLFSASASTYITGTTHLIPGQWYHIVCTWDGLLMKLYVNGSSDATPSVQDVIPITNVYNLLIGQDNVLASTNYNGDITNVKIFNYVVTESQVKFLYDNPYFMFEMPEEYYEYVAVGGFQSSWARNSNQLIYGVYQ